MSNKTLIAIVDCLNLVGCLESTYRLERYQIKDAIEAVVLMQIDVVVTNSANWVHDIGQPALTVNDFIPDMTEILSDHPSKDMCWSEVLYRVTCDLNDDRLHTFWESVRDLDIDILKQHIEWNGLDLYVTIN